MDAWLNHARTKLADLVWNAYEHAPQSLIDAAGYLKPCSQALSDWRVPLTLLRGSMANGQEAMLLIAGSGGSVEYMVARFFSTPPQRQGMGSVSLPALPRALRRLRGGADMTIAQVPKLLSDWLGAEEYLRVPTWVRTQCAVPNDPLHLSRGNRRLREELRPMRQNALIPHISHDPADFEYFYHDMYLPFARERFGSNAAVRPMRQLRRGFRRGALLWICKKQERLAAALIWKDRSRMVMASLGLPRSGEAAKKAGAISAIYYFGIQHAKACGCATVDFGGCRPSPGDGVTSFKRKWGVSLSLPRLARTELLFRWEQPNAAVRSFISHTPLIVRQGKELSLLVAPEQGRGESAPDALWMRGLQRMYVLNHAASSRDCMMAGVSLSGEQGLEHQAATPLDM